MLKNKKMRGIFIGIAVVVALSATVFAKQVTETINVMYDNIKILIDGVEYTPTDANGNTVEPFIYNGTTYLPVRGIANAFDVDVNWDETNSTVELGYSKVDYLSQLSYVDYATNNEKSKFSVENTYDLVFDTCSGYGTEDPKKIGKQSVTYKLENAYDYFICDLTSTKPTAYGIAYVNIYGNNKDLLYSSIGITTKDTSIPISLNVEGQNILYIEIVNDIDHSGSNLLMKNARVVR